MNYENYPKLPPPYFDLSDAYTVCQLREAQKKMAAECNAILLLYANESATAKEMPGLVRAMLTLEERFGPFDE